jgi:hypothetical protein
MLQKAMIPFGVDGGTRSSAADKIITYKTSNAFNMSIKERHIYVPLLIKPKRKKEMV